MIKPTIIILFDFNLIKKPMGHIGHLRNQFKSINNEQTIIIPQC